MLDRTELRRLPKVELHLHLEGAVRLTTLRELAEEKAVCGVRAAAPGEDPLNPYREFFTLCKKPTTSLTTFLVLFQNLKLVLDSEQVLERIAWECVESAVENGVVLLELRYSPQYLVSQNMDLDQVHAGIMRGLSRAKKTFGDRIAVGLICIIDRSMSLQSARDLAAFVLKYRDDFVGVDLANDELFPATIFAPIFRKLKETGLGVTIHAGESGTAANVQEAIVLLGATRIGHGIKVLQDDSVIELARTSNVLLEVCPISNYCTSVVPSYAAHPIRELIAKGLRVSLNTDDPGVFDSDIIDEYEWLATQHGFTAKDFRALNQDAVMASFLQPSVKNDILATYFE
ncbi:hypothetical protein HDU91_006253 [Kappamyces sp. JEL0680]|nr:hypothetical protein HDU91_006253 [Kappamyces sp. JEL0680]